MQGLQPALDDQEVLGSAFQGVLALDSLSLHAHAAEQNMSDKQREALLLPRVVTVVQGLQCGQRQLAGDVLLPLAVFGEQPAGGHDRARLQGEADAVPEPLDAGVSLHMRLEVGQAVRQQPGQVPEEHFPLGLHVPRGRHGAPAAAPGGPGHQPGARAGMAGAGAGMAGRGRRLFERARRRGGAELRVT